MALNLIDPKSEYEKESKLKQEDVKSFMEWVNMRPHLPEINGKKKIFHNLLLNNFFFLQKFKLLYFYKAVILAMKLPKRQLIPFLR